MQVDHLTAGLVKIITKPNGVGLAQVGKTAGSRWPRQSLLMPTISRYTPATAATMVMNNR